ncbi:MAG: flagellar protein FliS [Lachnospiraceae bacterium]|nr:flagellar protein FliS [Lachnospiraceae bacterium]
MDKEKKQEFTRRITQSNRGQLVAICYEIGLTYLGEAMCAGNAMDWEEFRAALRQTDQVLVHLQERLNFQYDLSRNLYQLYDFSRRQLMQAMYQRSVVPVQQVEQILKELHEAFQAVAAQDESAPLMQNAQQVYAGMTYGKEQLNESFQGLDHSRGFFA